MNAVQKRQSRGQMRQINNFTAGKNKTGAEISLVLTN